MEKLGVDSAYACRCKGAGRGRDLDWEVKTLEVGGVLFSTDRSSNIVESIVGVAAVLGVREGVGAYVLINDIGVCSYCLSFSISYCICVRSSRSYNFPVQLLDLRH